MFARLKEATFMKSFFKALPVIAVLAGSAATAMADEEYSFVVHNKTKTRIVKILVSENGRKYGHFDIGKGIRPGEKVTLVWDKSTNSQSCKQWIKAVYADGSEARPAKFDFCEDDLEIEFED